MFFKNKLNSEYSDVLGKKNEHVPTDLNDEVTIKSIEEIYSSKGIECEALIFEDGDFIDCSESRLIVSELDNPGFYYSPPEPIEKPIKEMVELANGFKIDARCWNAIQEVNAMPLEEFTFEKISTFKTYGQDDVSRLSPDDFDQYIDAETMEFVRDMFNSNNDKHREGAMRWIIRGLNVEHAVKYRFYWKRFSDIVTRTEDGKIFDETILMTREDYIYFLARANGLRLIREGVIVITKYDG